ncbi:hypothetical protein HY413_02995 [Candidatus Kaiserbacteria bacterium]|nr:hypothetical protein [Candidatus Kaiserbacteria bacterium]
MIRKSISGITIFAIGAIFSSVVAFAWTGPTQTAPNGNVSAPINVGTTDQTKNAALGVNSLAVFGNAIISTVGGYLNFGTTAGAGGYGIRDNVGTMEFKNSGGAWQAIATTTSGGGSSNAGISAQIFTASGTFTVPSGVTSVKAILIGGGGGGPTFGCVGGGGGSGTATKWVTGLTPGAAVPVVVGVGGSSGATGGTSSFVGVTASGGFASGSTVGGTGGSTSGADLGVIGGSGSNAGCAWGSASVTGGSSQGEYSNLLGYSFGRGGGTGAAAQSGVVIIQW